VLLVNTSLDKDGRLGVPQDRGTVEVSSLFPRFRVTIAVREDPQTEGSVPVKKLEERSMLVSAVRALHDE